MRPRLRIIEADTQGYPTGYLRAPSDAIEYNRESRKVSGPRADHGTAYGYPVPPLCFGGAAGWVVKMGDAKCNVCMLHATSAGLAEQAAGGGGRKFQKNTKSPKTKKKNQKPKSQKAKKLNKKNPPPWRKNRKLPPAPPGRLAQGGEKGGGGGEEEVAEESAEALAVRVAQRGLEVPEQFCSQLKLGLRRDGDLPQASIK